MSVIGQSEGIEHGTMKGYRQHRYRKVEMCDPCRDAELKDQARRKAGLPPVEQQADETDRLASDAQKAWNGGHFTPEQMAVIHGQRRQRKAAPVVSLPYRRPYPPYLPGHQDPAWGVSITGRELVVGDVIVYLGREYPVDRFKPYVGSLSGVLGDGARTAFSAAWEMAVGSTATIRILPREAS